MYDYTKRKEGMDGRDRLKKSPDNGASWARRDLQVFSFSCIINMLLTYNYTGDGRGVHNHLICERSGQNGIHVVESLYFW